MNNPSNKPVVVLDIDDTLLKSSEQIIRMICKKYNVDKTIEDLKDWNYRSITKLMDEKQVTEMYSSDEFFENVELNDGVLEFIEKYKNKFHFAFCTKGSVRNLSLKEKFCHKMFGDDFTFYGIEFGHKEDNPSCLDKSSIDLSHALFCVDDNTSALSSMNVPIKFLIKNHRDLTWNCTMGKFAPPVDERIHIVNSFYDIISFCEFFDKISDGDDYFEC